MGVNLSQSVIEVVPMPPISIVSGVSPFPIELMYMFNKSSAHFLCVNLDNTISALTETEYQRVKDLCFGSGPYKCGRFGGYGNGLATSVFGIGNGVPNDILEKDLEDASCLLVDETADAFDSTTPSQSPNGRLGDALNVIPEHLPVPLGTSLSQSLSSLSST
ncbi:hypothetical protein GH714_043287 [Hevea brasiliensis]|uniref:Uncharacterized protein n=1 Tax=Hevea brasiliensis TaxID=3981 RepID=A0A6A6K448_HEVBR|nr:hypothetical protein GH714_043287 [Hevea brasiliensis]